MAINWYAALSIKERLDVIKTHKFDIRIGKAAREKYEKHKNLYTPFFEDFMAEKRAYEFEKEVASEKNIIKTYTNYEPSGFSTKPDWLIRLTDAYTTFHLSHPNRLKFHHPNTTTQSFWSFFEPLFSAYVSEINEELDALSVKQGFSLVQKKDLTLFFEPAVEKIALMAERAFVLELRIAKQSDELQGKSTTERFHNFFEQLKEPTAALNFFEIYPLLGRMAYEVCNNWKTYFIEIITNLYADLLELQAKIPPLSIGVPLDSKIHVLTHIHALLTDGAQTGGRTVAILTFNEDIKVVYKPRDSAIDVAFGQFLGWFNAQNVVPPIRHAAIASRPNHSWYEFIAPEKDMTFTELPTLYTKLGSLLCLMYLFDTIDMHTANLIVVGDDPILIDLETWLQPLLPNETRHRSVTHTHLLPDIKPVIPDAFDLEGLADVDLSEKTWTERKELVWENEGTDDMRIVRKRLPIDKTTNSIIIDGEVINSADYSPYIVKGFRRAYRHIAIHKTEFLETLSCFNDKKLRSILRGSKKYDALIEDMAHPTHLQDAIALEQFLDRLWIEASDDPYLKPLIGIEKKDLINLDNPYFYTYSDSKTLFYNNQPLIKDFFETSALDIVQQNLDDMSTKDLEQQVRIIRRAFATLKGHYSPKEAFDV